MKSHGPAETERSGTFEPFLLLLWIECVPEHSHVEAPVLTVLGLGPSGGSWVYLSPRVQVRPP